VVGGDAVAQHRQHARALDVADRTRRLRRCPSKYGGSLMYVDAESQT
jgi:hypothetical protein